MELKLIIGFIVLLVIVMISIMKTRKKKTRKNSKPSKPYSGSSSINRKPKSQPREQTLSQIVGKLNDSRDSSAVKDITFNVATEKTQKTMYAIKKNKPVAMQTLNLEIDTLMNQVEQLIKKANRIAGNASVNNFRPGSENFKYNNELWFRTRLAGIAFLKASDLVDEKLKQLHRIDFSDISAEDRKRIKKLQAEDGLVSLKRDLLNCAKIMFRLNKGLKELIRNNSGRGGKIWAEHRDNNGEDARFEAKRKQQYGF